jgi:hypothetical protein
MNNINQTNLSTVDFKSNFKKGEACSWTVMFFGPFGSTSIIDAAKDGNISKVELTEQTSNIYPFVSKTCTIVYGKN